jgi:hypothetical protein
MKTKCDRKVFTPFGALLLASFFLGQCTCTTNAPTEQTAAVLSQGPSEFQIKAYLIRKYDPKACFGMPKVIREETVRLTLERTPDLVAFIKEEFGHSTDHNIHNVIEQLRTIALTKTDEGYDFTMRDGRCCTITTYKGRIRIQGSEISDEVTAKSVENVPC